MVKLTLWTTLLIIIISSVNSESDCGKVKITKPTPLIVNGEPAYHGQFPWLAPLFHSGKYICGSSIISQWHLLTATHCVSDTKSYKYHALVGRFNLSDESELHWKRKNISAIYTHEDYNITAEVHRSDGDIAIFRVTEKIKYSAYIQPICLPDESINSVNKNGMTAGYGKTDIYGDHQITPSYVTLKSISSWRCDRKGIVYANIVAERSFCAGDPANETSIPCQGDSGGAFLIHDRATSRHTMLGIVSFSIGLCNPKDYVAFADVTQYIQWINETIEFDELLFGESSDPCENFDCGDKGECQIRGGKTECVCLRQYSGTYPQCGSACSNNLDCPDDRACLLRVCTDLCMLLSQCVDNAQCILKNHRPTCECLNGYEGNGYSECIQKIKERTEIEENHFNFTLFGSRTIQHGSRYGIFVNSKLKGDDKIVIQLSGSKSVTHKIRAKDKNMNDEKILEFNLDENRLAKNYKLSILSHRNGMCAYDEIPITPVRKEYSVFIQMDKPLYKPKDTVKFRIVMIDENTRPYQRNIISTKIIDVKGEIIQKFLVNDDKVKNGIYEDAFDLADEPNFGIWNLSLIINGRENEVIEKSFEVKKYVIPPINVNIESKSYLLPIDKTISLTVSAKYSHGINDKGTAVLTIKVYDSNRAVKHVMSKNLNIEKQAVINLDVEKDLKIMSSDSEQYIEVKVNFTDELKAQTFTKVKEVKLRHGNSFNIKVFNPKTFTAGDHYDFFVSIKDIDGIPQYSKTHPVIMKCENVKDNEEVFNTTLRSFMENGFARFSWLVPNNIQKLKITVDYRDSSNFFVVVNGNDSKNENFEVSITDKEPSLQQMITVHLNAVSNIGVVNYVVTGRLGLAQAGTFDCQHKKTCEISIEPNEIMLPEATVMVYFVNKNDDIVYDTTKVNFKEFSSNYLTLKTARNYVLPGSKVNLDIESSPNSFVALLGIDESLKNQRSGNDIDNIDVSKDLFAFGHTDNIMNHPKAKIIENSFVYYQNYENLHQCTAAERAMLSEDNDRHLVKRSVSNEKSLDYSLISENPEDEVDPDEPRFRRDYREVFLFESTNIGSNGKSTIDIQMPDNINKWLITGFAMNEEKGFALAEPIQITTIQQMIIKLNLPSSIKFGEVLKVEATVFNFIPSRKPLKVDVTMINFDINDKDDKYFEFIEFRNCQPIKLDEEEMTKSTIVPQFSAKSAFFHIRALRSGEIKILVKAKSPRAKDAVEKKLIVEHDETIYFKTENIEINLKNTNEFSKQIILSLYDSRVIKIYATTSHVIHEFNPNILPFNANVQMKTDSNEIHNFEINSMNANPQDIVLFKSDTRMITITASKKTGSGTCYASIEFQTAMREENVIRIFDLDINVLSRDSRSATIRVCGKFNSDGIIEQTLMTLMEIYAPNGYVFDKTRNDLNAQNLKGFRKLDLKNKETLMMLYFETFSSTIVCPTLHLIKINQVMEVTNQKKSVARIYYFFDPSYRATTFYSIDGDQNCTA